MSTYYSKVSAKDAEHNDETRRPTKVYLNNLMPLLALLNCSVLMQQQDPIDSNTSTEPLKHSCYNIVPEGPTRVSSHINKETNSR